MKFNYQDFRKKILLGNNPLKSSLLQEYEATYPRNWDDCDLKDTTFFQHYLLMFPFPFIEEEPLDLPAESIDRYDWQSLICLSTASFLTEYEIKWSSSEKKTIEFTITFYSSLSTYEQGEPLPISILKGDTEFEMRKINKIKQTKKLSELTENQINALFEFYILERIKTSIESFDDIAIRANYKKKGLERLTKLDDNMQNIY